MAKERLYMRKIEEVLRLRFELKHSHRQIVGVGRTLTRGARLNCDQAL